MVWFMRRHRGRLGDLGLALVVGSAGALGHPEGAVALALLGTILVLAAS